MSHANGDTEDPRTAPDASDAAGACGGPAGEPSKGESGARDAPSVHIDLVTNPATDRLMGELAAKLGIGKADVLSMGLALLKIATDARGAGKKLAIIDGAGNVAEVEL